MIGQSYHLLRIYERFSIRASYVRITAINEDDISCFMTVKSKPATNSADIVDLPVAGQSSAGRSFRSGRRLPPNRPRQPAILLSVKQHLSFRASVCLADLTFIEQTYSTQVTDKLLLRIRELLEREFGSLRVYRHHQLLVVNHYCVESLVAGLLRVQFHCGEIPLSARRDGRGLSDMCGLPLSWGIGQTRAEAELNRLDKVAHQ